MFFLFPTTEATYIYSRICVCSVVWSSIIILGLLFHFQNNSSKLTRVLNWPSATTPQEDISVFSICTCQYTQSCWRYFHQYVVALHASEAYKHCNVFHHLLFQLRSFLPNFEDVCQTSSLLPRDSISLSHITFPSHQHVIHVLSLSAYNAVFFPQRFYFPNLH